MTDPAPPSRALLALAEARVPRYTSYPTAAQFGPLDETAWRGWMRGIGPADPLSIYVHVPFCRDLCWYCACHTRATRSEARIRAYAESLLAEVALLAEAVPAHGGIAHLHLGGGTPSILGPDNLAELVHALRHRFGFRAGAEFAIELDPRLFDAPLAETLGALGFTRASLGVQDIDPAVQARIGRPQPTVLVETAVERLRRAGIRAVNIDLMYGLPGQTAAHVAASARFAASLSADRIAVFGYAHVPWMKPHQKAIDTIALPDTLARLEQAEAAEAALAGEGYLALGLDHFARPGDPLALAAFEGRLRRNFQGYTTDTAPALLGLGASSIGSLPGGFGQNLVDERRWAEAIAEGHLPIARGVATTPDDRQRANLIEWLMCDFALDLRNAPAILNKARMDQLEQEGLIRREGTRLTVTPMGRRFVRQVAACFDAYLAPEATRHSAAV